MPKPPSPCIDVCKYKLRGHCIACSMTKMQKKLVERLDGQGRRAFIAELLVQQKTLGDRFRGWEIAYRAKCARKERPCVIDQMRAADATAAE